MTDMAEKSLLTVKEKIVLHLSEFPPDKYITDDRQREIFGVLPHALSQKGIADAVGIRWNHVPRSLKGLVNEDLVQVRSGMVEGHMRRVNVYFLTEKGIEVAGEIKERLADVTIKVRTEDQVQEMSVPALVEYLGGTVPVLSILILSNDGRDVVQLDALQRFGREDQMGTTRVHMLGDAPLVTRFLGREREMEAMRRILEERKVLVVAGITGIGKSTLVSKLTEGYKDRYSVMWCNITEWDTMRAVLGRIAEFFALNGRRELKQMLGRTSFQENEVIEQIGALLTEVPALLVFDDHEKGNEEVRQFFGMLFEGLSGGDLKMIVISRTNPDFYDRREVNVRQTIGEIKLSGLTFEATDELLSARGFSRQNIDVLYKITGGHPLALELIRNPDDVKKPSDLYRFVQDELLADLGPEEREVLAYASVLSYPNEIDVLLHVDPPMEALDRLIDLNLIQDLPSGMIYLHNLVREVAFHRLSAEDVRRHCRTAADYFLGKGTVYDSLKGIGYLIRGGFFDDACEVIGEVGGEALNRGLMAEVRSILNEIEDHIPTDQFYKIFILQGDMNFLEAEHAAAVTSYEKALKSTSESNFLARSHVYRQMGLLALKNGDIEGANNNLQIALDMANQSGDKAVLASVNGAIARLHIHKGEHDRAKKLLDIAIEYALEASHDTVYHDLLIDMGRIYIAMGDVERGMELARVSLEHFENRDDVYKMAQVYSMMAEAVAPEGAERALHYWDLAIEVGRRSGAHDVLLSALIRSSGALADLGRHGEALKRLAEAERILETGEDRLSEDDLHRAFGIVLASKGELEAAEDHLRESMTIAEESGAPLRVAETEHLLGRLLIERRKKKEGKKHLDRAVTIFKERGQVHLIQSILDELDGLKG